MYDISKIYTSIFVLRITFSIDAQLKEALKALARKKRDLRKLSVDFSDCSWQKWQLASALSFNEFRVKGFEFGPSVFDFELPVDSALFVVAVLRPSKGFLAKDFDVSDAAALQALSRQ